MKTFVKSFVFGGMVFLIVYLIGAFVFADLNIIHWPLPGRAFVGFSGGLAGLSVMGASMYIMSNKK